MSEHQYEALRGHDYQWQLLKASAITFGENDNLDDVFGDMKSRLQGIIADDALFQERLAAVAEIRKSLHPYMGLATLNVLGKIYDILSLTSPDDLEKNAHPSMERLFGQV